jgi:FdrA protein
VVASVCGTPADPQGLERQEARLRAAGVLLAPTNAAAARAAAQVVGGTR